MAIIHGSQKITRLKMDIRTINASNLTEYTALSRGMGEKLKEFSIDLTLSIILKLDKLKSLELEYFQKYEEGGAVFQIFNKLLVINIPSTKWQVLMEKILAILTFWFTKIEATLHVRLSGAMWRFLKHLVYFLKQLGTKNTFANIKALDMLGEEILAIATSEKLDENQRLEVLQGFNMCCTHLSKGTRQNLKAKFEHHFEKLAHLVPSSGDLRMQAMTIETLLRWLVPRDDISLRKKAAAVWFPNSLYSREVVQIFLEKQWTSFIHDVRELLNAINKCNPLIVSLLCKRMSFGDLQLVTAANENCWLDFNVGNKCISMLLDRELLQVLKVETVVYDTLAITESNAVSVTLIRNSEFTVVKISVKEPKLSYDCEALKAQYGVSMCMEKMDFDTVDRCLRHIFAGKCEILLSEESADIYKECSEIENSEDNSHLFALEVNRRALKGTTKEDSKSKSPSAAATSSQRLLREKVSRHKTHFKTNKEHKEIRGVPQLSRITEESEERTNRSGTAFRSANGAPAREPFDGFTHSQEFSRDSMLLFLSTQERDLAGSIDDNYEDSNLTSDFIENTPLIRSVLETSNFERERELLFNNKDAIPCLSGLVSKVCEDLGNSSSNLFQDHSTGQILSEPVVGMLKKSPSTGDENESKSLKLTFPKSKATANKDKKVAVQTGADVKNPKIQTETTGVRRKRKLFSTKNNLLTHASGGFVQGTVEDDTIMQAIPSTSKTCREADEKKVAQKRSAKEKPTAEKSPALLPRPKILDEIFDNLYHSADNDENLFKTNNKKQIEIYNFNGSDDSDFNQNKNITMSRGSFSRRQKRRRSEINYSELEGDWIDGWTADEKMRDASPERNNSLEMDQPQEVHNVLMPVIAELPAIEDIGKPSTAGKKAKTARKKKAVAGKSRPAKDRQAGGKGCKGVKAEKKAEKLTRNKEESLSPMLVCELQPPRRPSNDSIEALEPINVIRETNAPVKLEGHVSLERTPLPSSPPQALEQSPVRMPPINDPATFIGLTRPRVSINRGAFDLGSRSTPTLLPRKVGKHDNSPAPDTSKYVFFQNESLLRDESRQAGKSLITPFKFKKQTAATRDRSEVNSPRKDLPTRTSPASNRECFSQNVAPSHDAQGLSLPRATEGRLQLPEVVQLYESEEASRSSPTDRGVHLVSDSPVDSDNAMEIENSPSESRISIIFNDDRSSTTPDKSDADEVIVNSFQDMYRAVHERIEAEFAAVRISIAEQVSRGVAEMERERQRAQQRRLKLYEETVCSVKDSVSAHLMQLEHKIQEMEDQSLEMARQRAEQMLAGISKCQAVAESLAQHKKAARRN